MFDWLTHVALLPLGLMLFASMIVAAAIGWALRTRGDHKDGNAAHNETQEGYIVSAVLSLLALLIGFTFALAVDRYEARRLLVVEDANAIERLYLQAQLLDEPHRSRITRLLVDYTGNHLAAARVQPDKAAALVAANDRLIDDLWTAVARGFDSIRGIDFSSTFVDSANQLVAADAARRAARNAQIPGPVFAVLFVYAIITAGILGYVLIGRRGRLAGAFLLALFTLALMLLSDINRPTGGSIRESQQPMERLMRVLHASQPALFDRWKTPAAAAPTAKPAP